MELKHWKIDLEFYSTKAVSIKFQIFKFSIVNKNDYIMKQGDDGDTYFIILDGKIQILVSTEVTQEYAWMELFQAIVENYEQIIDNEQKQSILKELKY